MGNNNLVMICKISWVIPREFRISKRLSSPFSSKFRFESYREVSNRMVFGTQKKTYWWKFLLLEEFLIIFYPFFIDMGIYEIKSPLFWSLDLLAVIQGIALSSWSFFPIRSIFIVSCFDKSRNFNHIVFHHLIVSDKSRHVWRMVSNHIRVSRTSKQVWTCL